MSVKTCDFFLRDFNRGMKLSNAFKYNFYLPFTHSPFLSSFFPPLSCVSKTFRLPLNHALPSHADGNAFLLICFRSLHLLLHLFLSLWVSGIVSQLSTKQTSFLLFLYNPHSASWSLLRPGFVQKSQQPLLLSIIIYHSHTPRQVGRGGGTSLLISNNWKYSTHFPLCN